LTITNNQYYWVVKLPTTFTFQIFQFIINVYHMNRNIRVHRSINYAFPIGYEDKWLNFAW